MKTRLLHHVTISVFSKPHDDEALVLHGLDQVSPVPTGVLLSQGPEPDPERPRTIYYRMPDVELMVQRAETDEGMMTIYTLFFKRMHDTSRFMKQLRQAMTREELEGFSEDPATLLDADGKLSCRLDKELLMREQWSLTDDGNCYQVRAAVAAYPKTPANVVRVLESILRA